MKNEIWEPFMCLDLVLEMLAVVLVSCFYKQFTPISVKALKKKKKKEGQYLYIFNNKNGKTQKSQNPVLSRHWAKRCFWPGNARKRQGALPLDTKQKRCFWPGNAMGLYLSTHSSNLSLIHAGFRDNVGKRSTSQELHDNLTHKQRHKDH